MLKEAWILSQLLFSFLALFLNLWPNQLIFYQNSTYYICIWLVSFPIGNLLNPNTSYLALFMPSYMSIHLDNSFSYVQHSKILSWQPPYFDNQNFRNKRLRIMSQTDGGCVYVLGKGLFTRQIPVLQIHWFRLRRKWSRKLIMFLTSKQCTV